MCKIGKEDETWGIRETCYRIYEEYGRWEKYKWQGL